MRGEGGGGGGGGLRERFFSDIPSLEMVQFSSCWSSWFCLGISSVTFQPTVLLLGIKNTQLIKNIWKKTKKLCLTLFLRFNNKRSRLKGNPFFPSSSCFQYDFYASQAQRNKDQPSGCCTHLGLGFSFFLYRKGRGCDSHRLPLTPSNPIVLFLFSFSLALQQNNSL